MSNHLTWARAAALPFVALVACNSAKYEKVPEAEVDATQKAAAETFATATLTAWNKEAHYPVSVPATDEFKAAQNDETKQKAAAKSIKADAGEFKSLTFHEVQRSDPPKHVIYRFKGSFAKKDPMEVRVVYTKDDKLGGFWIKPWKDALN